MTEEIAQRCILLFALVTAAPVRADEVTITPQRDNTLIEDATGSLSNGQGSLFCGRTGPLASQRRLRLVAAFDVAANIPAGSIINSAELRLRLEQSNNLDGQTHSLHRLLADWGEGASTGLGGSGAPAEAGDATWLHRFYPSDTWINPGGDFLAAVSASQTVASDFTTDYVWSSPQLALDVQSFLDRPACNFGWVMRGNETGSNTAKRFASLQALDAAIRPRLIINFTPPAVACPSDINASGAVEVDDLLAVINAWGACQPCPAACDADIDPAGGDQQVDVNDLLDVINSWGPCS